MSAFTEFVLVAIALYLWESTLWLPLRTTALRRKWFGKGWKALDPRSVMAGKELGMIPLLPLPTDSGIAPCQSPPLVATTGGEFLMETANGTLSSFKALNWNDLSEKDHYLVVKEARTRITSPRYVGILRRAKKRGLNPQEGVALAWRLALSPARAGREWKRWRVVSGPLRFYGPALAVGLFAGLPLSYILLGIVPLLIVVAWLWVLMIFTACHLLWLGKRVYPDARGALRMDALLSIVVPFHAMRASEIASVHAMGTTHPVGLMLSSGDTQNPWLANFVRRILHPLPESKDEAAFCAAIRPTMESAFLRQGKLLRDYDSSPDRSEDPEATRYCPRCHESYLHQVETCPDCKGLPLRDFDFAATAKA